MRYAGGVDVGSTQTKAVIIDGSRNIVARKLIDTGANVIEAAQNAFKAALAANQIAEDAVKFVIGTGYGRYKVTFGDKQVTEISCHGRGAAHMFPGTGTVLDMGGQDSKAIRVKPCSRSLTCRTTSDLLLTARQGRRLRSPSPTVVTGRPVRSARPPTVTSRSHRTRATRLPLARPATSKCNSVPLLRGTALEPFR